MNKKIYPFLLVMFYSLTMYGQPGGVGGANFKMWVKSNSGISTTGSLVDSWTYANDNTKSFTSAGTDRPTLTSNGINFQPVLTFAGSQMMDGPNGPNAPIVAGDDDYSVFVVWRSTSVTAFQRVWSQRDFGGVTPNGFSVATWNDGTYGDQVEVSPYNHTIQRPYTQNAWNITQLNLLNQATNDLEIIDNGNLSTSPLVLNTDPSGTPNGAALRTLADVLNRIGARDAAGQEGLLGNIAEIIVYDRPVSGTDRNQIFSYLALKYGIPIQTNLVSSNGTTIWNATTNSTYNNAVFGIGRDNTSGLLVTSSNSVVTGSGDGTGQSGKANMVISNPTLTDQSFLIVGNDNGSLTESTTEIPSTAAGSKRLPREWKVQNTGGVGRVNVDFDFTGLTVSGTIGNPLNFRLMVDVDGDGNFNTGTIWYYVPVSFTGNVANFTNVGLGNNYVFSIITQAAAGTPLPVKWVGFNAKANKDDVYLDWTVANNDKGQSYVVEHSSNGINFSDLVTINNNAAVKNYSYIHKNVGAGQHYYRIRQIDLDGATTYSKIVTATIKSSDFVITLQNNPVRGNQVEIEIKAVKKENALIELWSVSGSMIVSKQVAINAGVNQVKISVSNLAKGNYVLKVRVNNEIQTEQVVKM